MFVFPENFCVAPFLQLTTHPTKSFSPCPYLGGTTWTKKYDSIDQQWKSDDLESLRNQFLTNQKADICQRCWHEEKNGKQSLRLRLYDVKNKTSDYAAIRDNNLVEELGRGLANKDYLAGPKILTIKNGNVCNAKCRSCHPGDSSRWVDDANKLGSSVEQNKRRLKILMQFDKDFSSGKENLTDADKSYYVVGAEINNWNDKQIEEIFELSKSVKRLELFGGEPLYNKKVIKLLTQLVEHGHSQNINLYINTNGSVNFVKLVPEIFKFKEVEVGVSIDGIGKKFEYIRHGIEYRTVIDNIRSWQEYFSNKETKFFIDSITTVSILNVFDLIEIKHEVASILSQSPFWNLLIYPDYLFIKNLPDELKQRAVEYLSQDDEFNDIVSIIKQPADMNAWETFLKITPALDKIRHEDLLEVLPVFANSY